MYDWQDLVISKSCLYSFVCSRGDTYYALLNVSELWCNTALIYVNDGQYNTVSQRTSHQVSNAKPPAAGVPDS